MGGNCRECGEPITADPIDLDEAQDPSDGPIETRNGLYCSLACQAMKTGWAYEG